tara:strand:+ start:62 stop:499 length:438 start_codon:yes stop_codon:yes gene_type:complete
MKLSEVQHLARSGVDIRWSNNGYKVIYDKKCDQFLVICTWNNYTTGLGERCAHDCYVYGEDHSKHYHCVECWNDAAFGTDRAVGRVPCIKDDEGRAYTCGYCKELKELIQDLDEGTYSIDELDFVCNEFNLSEDMEVIQNNDKSI